MKTIFVKLKVTGKTLLQRLLITIQLYGENGLANHAAACAYGFLLSMAPMLLLIVLFIFMTIESSTAAIFSLIETLPFLDVIFDEQWFHSDLFTVSKPGIPGVISVISVFWAARILALSMQRALKVIFPSAKNRNPVMDTVVTLATEAVVLFFVLIAITGSRTAMRLYQMLNFLPENSILHIAATRAGNSVFIVVLLGIIAFIVYLFVPVNSPRKSSAFQGALFCAVTCFGLNMALGSILNTSMYNLLYGTLGNMIIMLVNVYFFFMVFFLGAQLSYVIDYFDSLLFVQLRQITIKSVKQKKHPSLMYKIFNPEESSLRKYLRRYKMGEIIISQGDAGEDIYFLLEGEAEILLPSLAGDVNSVGMLKSGSFFGEMGYLLSEERAATIRASTDVSVFALPPVLFETILKHDTSLDRDLIEHITRRLKNMTEQMITLRTGN